MSTEKKKTTAAAPKTPGSAPKRATTPADAAAPRASRAKTVTVDGEVSARVKAANAEGTKRGPGRPRKEQAGNLYEVTYQGSGKSAEAPLTRIIRAPDTSTAICKANGLNGLEKTHHFVMKATLINENGVPLDPSYDGATPEEIAGLRAADRETASMLLGDKPETDFDPIQQQNVGS